MSNSTVFRLAGWSAIIGAIASVIGFAISFSVPQGAPPPLISFIILDIGTLTFIPIAYALYLLFRAMNSSLSLGALALGVVGALVSLADPTSDTPVGVIASVVLGLSLLAFGYLMMQSKKLPTGVMLLTYLGGMLSILAPLLFGVLGQAGLVLLILSILDFVVLSLWLGRLFLSGTLTPA